MVPHSFDLTYHSVDGTYVGVVPDLYGDRRTKLLVTRGTVLWERLDQTGSQGARVWITDAVLSVPAVEVVAGGVRALRRLAPTVVAVVTHKTRLTPAPVYPFPWTPPQPVHPRVPTTNPTLGPRSYRDTTVVTRVDHRITRNTRRRVGPHLNEPLELVRAKRETHYRRGRRFTPPPLREIVH